MPTKNSIRLVWRSHPAVAIRAGYKHPDIGRQLLTKTHVAEEREKAMLKQSGDLNSRQKRIETAAKTVKQAAGLG